MSISCRIFSVNNSSAFIILQGNLYLKNLYMQFFHSIPLLHNLK
jgi:hypothetical protein